MTAFLRLKSRSSCSRARVGVLILAFVTLSTLVSVAAADERNASPDLEEVSKKLDNPFSDLWLLYVENDVGFYRGFPTRSTKVINTVLLNPVLTFPLMDEWTLITRPAVPIVSAPKPQLTGTFGAFPDQFPSAGFGGIAGNVKTDRQTELGDISLPFNVAAPLIDVPGTDGQIFTAAGAIVVFPTASDDFFGSERFSLGPAAAAGYLGEKWVFGLTLQHWKDVAGENDVPSVHMSSFQYFISYKLPDFWSIGTGPDVLVNWEADDDNKLTFPIGLSINKTMLIGGVLPVRAGISGEYSVVHPDDFGQRWMIKASLSVVVPSPFGSLVP